MIRWIEEDPAHPQRAELIAHLHKIQDDYLGLGREYMGWAMYVLAPRSYNTTDATEPPDAGDPDVHRDG